MPIIPIIRSGGPKPSGKIEITENGTGIDVAQYAEADVAVLGDFSTCTITFAGTEGDSITGYCPVVIDLDPIAACEGKFDSYVGDTLTAILYKGEGYLYASGIDTVTGDAEIVESGVVKYTGDCTITLFHAG